MLRALQLALRSATPTYKLHSQCSLHVIIKVVLLVLHLATALHLTPIVRLVALATLKEHHLGHGQLGDPVLFAWVARSKCGPPVLHNPTLQCLSSDLTQCNTNLTQGAAYAFEREPSAASISFPHQSLCTVMVHNVATRQADRRSSIQWLCPAYRTPIVSFRQRWRLRGS